MRLVFYTVTNSRYFAGTVATLSSIRMFHRTEPICVIEESRLPLTTDQRAFVSALPHVRLLKSADLPVGVVHEAWQSKAHAAAYLIAECATEADALVQVDSDLILAKSVDDLARESVELDRPVGGRDGKGVRYDPETYKAYFSHCNSSRVHATTVTNPLYVSTSLLFLPVNPRYRRLCEMWSYAVDRAIDFGPASRPELRFPGSSDQGIFNAILYYSEIDPVMQDNDTTSEHWVHGAQFVDFRDGGFYKGQKRQVAFHSVGDSPKFWEQAYAERVEKNPNLGLVYLYWLFLLYEGPCGLLGRHPPAALRARCHDFFPRSFDHLEQYQRRCPTQGSRTLTDLAPLLALGSRIDELRSRSVAGIDGAAFKTHGGWSNMREVTGADWSVATRSFACVAETVLRRKQEGNGTASFIVNNREFGIDPAPLQVKVLYVETSDKDKRYCGLFNEHELVVLDLARVNLELARYGVFEDQFVIPDWGSSPAPAPDRIVCLSLESRPERWQEFMASVATNSQLLQRAEIVKYRATPAKEMLIPDWWQHQASHYATAWDELNIIEGAYMDGCQSLMLFEDDAQVAPDFDIVYRNMMRAVPQNWMGVWFGGKCRRAAQVAPGVFRVAGARDHCCFMLSRRGMHRVFGHCRYRFTYFIDQSTEELHRLEPHFYAPSRPVVSQTADRNFGSRPAPWWRGGEGAPAIHDVLTGLLPDLKSLLVLGQGTHECQSLIELCQRFPQAEIFALGAGARCVAGFEAQAGMVVNALTEMKRPMRLDLIWAEVQGADGELLIRCGSPALGSARYLIMKRGDRETQGEVAKLLPGQWREIVDFGEYVLFKNLERLEVDR